MLTREHRHSSRGFTLIELMIVIVVLAVLVTIALPSYQGYVTRTNRSAAKAALLQVAQRQEQFFGNNKSYGDELTTHTECRQSSLYGKNGGEGQDSALAFQKLTFFYKIPEVL